MITGKKPDWYVIYTRPKFEKSICNEIDYMSTGESIYESYFPVRNVLRKWSDRVKKIDEPLFSCYVFVQTLEKYRGELLKIPGVIRFMLQDGKAATISNEEIDRIRIIETGAGDIQNEPYYSVGDHVMVTRGVFKGMEGLLLKTVSRGARMLIRLPLLKQAVSVEVLVEDVI